MWVNVHSYVWLYIDMCVGKPSWCCFPICSSHLSSFCLNICDWWSNVFAGAHTLNWLRHIHHNISVWNPVNESHFSLLWHLLPVSQTAYLYQKDHLPRTQKAHYWQTDLFILATSARDSSPRQLALVSSSSGLGRHPNCSLKHPHSSRILQDASH